MISSQSPWTWILVCRILFPHSSGWRSASGWTMPLPLTMGCPLGPSWKELSTSLAMDTHGPPRCRGEMVDLLSMLMGHHGSRPLCHFPPYDTTHCFWSGHCRVEIPAVRCWWEWSSTCYPQHLGVVLRRIYCGFYGPPPLWCLRVQTCICENQ